MGSRQVAKSGGTAAERYRPEGGWIIDPRWFRHLAPAALVQHLPLFDYLYRDWLGRELAWERENGRRFAIRPQQIVMAILKGEKLDVPLGDPIPTIEIMVETRPGQEPTAKALPRWLMRTVTEADVARLPGRTPGTMRSDPTFILEAGPAYESPERAGFVRQVFIAAAHLLIKPRLGLPLVGPKPYTVYCHSFGDVDREEEPNHLYYGVTQRSWQERWAEHARSIQSGSHLKFHRTFREEVSKGAVSFVAHEVIGVTDDLDDLDDLYDWEEELVAAAWGDPMLLNMIPGGKAGIAYMAKHGLLGKRESLRPDERDSLLERWLASNDRTGVPAPWMAERWRDGDWAASFVCSGVGRLTVEQVRYIRRLGGEGLSDERVRELSGARTLEQVRGVLSGQRYSRVA